MRIATILAQLTAGLAAALVLGVPAGTANSAVLADPVKARLVADAGSVTPGRILDVALHLDIAPGWHTYWRNPGDAGLPTEIAWELPAGFSAGDILWPAPERFVLGAIGNYGYAGSVDLLVPIAVPGDVKPGSTVHLAADATWLVCSDICIPGEAKLALDLPVSAAPVGADPPTAALFAAMRDRLPQKAEFATRFTASAKQLKLFVPAAALRGVDAPSAAFFPIDGNVIDAAAEPKEETGPDGLTLVLARQSGAGASLPATLDGVLVLRGAGGAERAYSISAPSVAGVAFDQAPTVAWWQALVLALLGGIALNLMPCVFPVLSLKLLGLAGAAHREEQWHHGIAYAAGVVLSFVLLGGVLLGLRAGGAAIGWGFQLQSPVVVGLLAYLLLAMGLSLSGVAEFGAGIAGLGGRVAGAGGLFGAFATGILATIVATPCTAPFMGTALGAALIEPAPIAFGIFAALGIGLALPLVLATAIPGLVRRLPRPGSWMVWFKQLLAFPLYGTVAWLVWVLIQEVGPMAALFALFGLVAVGFAVWIYGRTRSIGMRGRHLGDLIAVAAVAAAVVLAMLSGGGETGGAPNSSAVQRDDFGYEPFSSARLARLTAGHRPVFVNLTAAWCITCLVNEHTALAAAPVRQAFAARGIVALKGDWTRRSPEITGFLQQFGRSGVPLYLLYDKAGTPTVLPQILTEASVLQALGKI